MPALPEPTNPKVLKLIDKLVTHKFIKFGEYKLKSGASSNYYVDLRYTTENLETFKLMCQLIEDIILHTSEIANISEPKVIVGIPNGGVPVAVAVATRCNLPYFPMRKETKDHGNPVESKETENYVNILIEDVMSSGSSIIETIQKIPNRNITDLIVIVNRKQGGDEKLKELYPNIRVHSIIDASQILEHHKQLASR